MPTLLLTGANRGIGLEFTRQYAADGWDVIATCRNPDGAGDLAAVEGSVEIMALDVDDGDQVKAASASLKRRPIDLLLNNAGIYGPKPSKLGHIDYRAWEEVMRINVLAPMRVAEAFVDQVAMGDLKKIVAVSSKMGSISDNTTGGSYIYRSSKAALNAAMKSLSVDVEQRGISVCVLHPGWVKTDMGGPSAQVDVGPSVTGMRAAIDGVSIDNTASFIDFEGNTIAW